MLYIFKKKKLTKKAIFFSLTSIFGISLTTSNKICNFLGINPSTKINDLNNTQIKKLLKYIENNLTVDNDLKKTLLTNKKNLLDIKKIKSLRILKGLPIRGQRTRTNAKTVKRLNKKLNIKKNATSKNNKTNKKNKKKK